MSSVPCPLARRCRLGSRSGNEGAKWRQRQAEECAQSQKPEAELNRNRAWSSRRKEEHPRKVLRSSSSPPIQAFIHSFIHPSTNTYFPPMSGCYQFQKDVCTNWFLFLTMRLRLISVCLGLCKHRFSYSLIQPQFLRGKVRSKETMGAVMVDS